MSRSHVITDFGSHDAPVWQSLDDRVMGGVSRSRLRITAGGTGVFEGHVSLEHGGGFASIRTRLKPLDLSSYDGIELRVHGDGKRYRLRLGSGRALDGVVHQAEFAARAGGSEIIRLSFAEFVPVFRGRPVAGAPPLDTGNVGQIGLMIVEEREADFRLEIEWIRAYAGAGFHAHGAP